MAAHLARVTKPHIEADLPSQILRVTACNVNTTAMWGFVSILHLLRVGCLVTTDYTLGLLLPSPLIPSLPVSGATKIRSRY
jgi:hypothetical protein